VQRELIVIGGSAGSVSALTGLIHKLSGELPAAVVVIVHLRARLHSSLPGVLQRATALPVVAAADGQRMEKGKVYVAIPDRHVLVANNHFHLSRGPKEGLHRPSINATFRSAAAAYGPGVIGVLLSGMLDDGAAGLWEITRHGGVAIVQDPSDTEFPSMPLAALQDSPVHYRLPASEIGPLLNKLVAGGEAPDVVKPSPEEDFMPEPFSGFSCPECNGPLFKNQKGPSQFRCLVGHAFTLPSLLEESSSAQERKIYEAVVALEQGAALAEYAVDKVDLKFRGQLIDEAAQLRSHATAIRKLLESRNEPPIA
jgi:two-component system chemotaxis response regulator CheB